MNLCRWKNHTIFLCKHTPIPLVRVQGYAGVWTSNTLPLPFIPLTQKHRGIPLPLSCLICKASQGWAASHQSSSHTHLQCHKLSIRGSSLTPCHNNVSNLHTPLENQGGQGCLETPFGGGWSIRSHVGSQRVPMHCRQGSIKLLDVVTILIIIHLGGKVTTDVVRE